MVGIESKKKKVMKLGLAGLIYLLVDIGCFIKFFTGISCPGCGMTRAWLSLLSFDIAKAYYYHPLFIFPLIGLIIYYFKDYLSERFLNGALVIAFILFMSVYIVRLNDQTQAVVVWNVKSGLIYQVFDHLKLLF